MLARSCSGSLCYHFAISDVCLLSLTETLLHEKGFITFQLLRCFSPGVVAPLRAYKVFLFFASYLSHVQKTLMCIAVHRISRTRTVFLEKLFILGSLGNVSSLATFVSLDCEDSAIDQRERSVRVTGVGGRGYFISIKEFCIISLTKVSVITADRQDNR